MTKAGPMSPHQRFRLDRVFGTHTRHGTRGSGRAIHPITPLDLGLFTVRRAAG